MPWIVPRWLIVATAGEIEVDDNNIIIASGVRGLSSFFAAPVYHSTVLPICF